jgi:hypothetical protein
MIIVGRYHKRLSIIFSRSIELFFTELYTKWNFDIAKKITHDDFKLEKSSVIGWQLHLLDIE